MLKYKKCTFKKKKFDNSRNHDQKSMLNAIRTQLAATNGLFLSPILAHFQNVPISL